MGTENLLGDAPHDRPWSDLPTQLRARLEPPELGLPQRLEGALDRLGQADRGGLWGEHRRIPVAIGERFPDGPLGQAGDLSEDAASGLLVDIRERRGAEKRVGAQHLEQVELDVAHVALVVPHHRSWSGPGRILVEKLLGGNVRILPVGNPAQRWYSGRSE